jgi:hypothetical protein
LIIKNEVNEIIDVVCDVCDDSTSDNNRCGPQFGTLHAKWGSDTNHNSEAYVVHLCESCFFQALANINEQRRGQLMFSEQGYEFNPDFGKVTTHD